MESESPRPIIQSGDTLIKRAILPIYEMMKRSVLGRTGLFSYSMVPVVDRHINVVETVLAE
jgi:hypothetical protein